MLVALVGLSLQYRATGVRTCVGHHPFRRPGLDHVDCARRPEPGGRRCRSCAIVEATFAANLHHAHTRETSDLDPSIVEHLGQTNLLYLAGFADGSIKVGTTTEHRTGQRLAEQGAWQANLVAEAGNGIAVRELEDRVTSELGIAQSVSIRRKLAGLTQRHHDATGRVDEALAAELDRTADRVRTLVEDLARPDLRSIDRHWTNPARERSVWRQAIPYPFRLDEGAHDVEVVDAIGRVVALRRGSGAEDVFLADIGVLFGVVLEIGDHGSPEFVVQDSLF